MPKIIVKNQLNNGLAIEFCCGDKEYVLEPEGETEIEIAEDVCMYFDVVKKPAEVLCNA
jgi:hypothetical protein